MAFTPSPRLVVAMMMILGLSVCEGILHKVAVARQGYEDEESYVYEDLEDSSGDDDLEGSSYVDEADESIVEEAGDENIVIIDPEDEVDLDNFSEDDGVLVIDEYEEEEEEGYRRKR